MLKKLFESLDEKVFTDELKESLTKSFNDAVELKAAELFESKMEEKEAELVNEAEEKEAALLEKVDAYLEKVVDDFVAEAKESLESSLVNEKADLMVEAFDAMLTAGGVDVAKIVEAKDETSVESKLAEKVEQYDSLVEANIALEKENAMLIKMGVINEIAEGLSLLERERFANVAGLVEFTKDKAYADKLETIKESITSKAKAEDTEQPIVESVNGKESWSHLV